ncbi:tumor necrosis factor receptor superfamily member 14-like [Sminthopsis crassicaudata]|uniref:tumor necrosis factor receptor superfamily member 14-like n=1 Tax=Sminthopsis crassicaudata TaxID=9301 RepID=UPI003D689FE3
MTKSRSQLTFPDILDYSLFLALIAFLFLAQAIQQVYGLCTGVYGGLYEVDGECCYPCDPGYRRVGPCNITRGTRCLSCDPGTYTTHKHVLNNCLLCKVCNSELGLVTKRECSSTSNTVCGCSPGYFCSDIKDDDCELCVPHRVCSPGQYMKSRGTERNNTICEKCQAGTFSKNWTLDQCLPWTKCTDLGLSEERPGTAITDARCSQDSHHQKIYFVIIPTIIIIPSILV